MEDTARLAPNANCRRVPKDQAGQLSYPDGLGAVVGIDVDGDEAIQA